MYTKFVHSGENYTIEREDSKGYVLDVILRSALWGGAKITIEYSDDTKTVINPD